MGNDTGMAFVAETGSGHAVVMDGAVEAGGRNIGLRPMEMVLAGTGGCTAFDVVLILKKGRHAVSGCEVSLKAERAERDPKIFTHIHFHYRVKGKQPEGGCCCSSHRAIKGQVLLCLDHDWKNCRDHARLRDH
jgi:putative redox protein